MIAILLGMIAMGIKRKYFNASEYIYMKTDVYYYIDCTCVCDNRFISNSSMFYLRNNQKEGR